MVCVPYGASIQQILTDRFLWRQRRTCETTKQAKSGRVGVFPSYIKLDIALILALNLTREVVQLLVCQFW